MPGCSPGIVASSILRIGGGAQMWPGAGIPDLDPAAAGFFGAIHRAVRLVYGRVGCCLHPRRARSGRLDLTGDVRGGDADARIELDAVRADRDGLLHPLQDAAGEVAGVVEVVDAAERNEF